MENDTSAKKLFYLEGNINKSEHIVRHLFSHFLDSDVIICHLMDLSVMTINFIYGNLKINNLTPRGILKHRRHYVLQTSSLTKKKL
jgi:hypothetical protein